MTASIKLLDPPAWQTVLGFDTPVLEIVLRGFITYVALFVLLRLVLKRQSGSVASDLLVIVLLADAAQNALADDCRSIPDGLLPVTVIIFTSYLLDWLGCRFPACERIIYPKPLPLGRPHAATTCGKS